MLWKDFFPGPIYLQQTFSKPFLTFSNISASMSPTWLPYKNQKGFCSRPNGYTRRGFSAFSADSVVVAEIPMELDLDFAPLFPTRSGFTTPERKVHSLTCMN